jgi:hypothetical protein
MQVSKAHHGRLTLADGTQRGEAAAHSVTAQFGASQRLMTDSLVSGLILGGCGKLVPSIPQVPLN